ncbi:MAG: DedA family protein, partial [Acidobacteriota bacterium]|nr:DedA family protein [Acidobacteriota bacterium]
MLASLSSSITSGIAHHGVYAVFALMLIDAVFPAVSELVMLYAGALAAGAIGGTHPLLFGSSLSFGATAFIVLALAGTLGYLAGGLIGWLIGIYGGRPLILRHGGWLHLNETRLSLAERWFDRYGSAFVLLGRITPLLRSFVSIPAGIFRVPVGRYSMLTLLGSAIWAFAFAGAGYGLGTSYTRVHHDFRYAEYTVILAAAVIA